MTWHLARSLEILRDQINQAAPGRSKKSDGTIGDAAHASRESDHNAWVKDGKGPPVVTGMDITHDPAAGVDCGAMAEDLRTSGDPRIKYLIWNRRKWNPAVSQVWRPYDGKNPHDRHLHISVKAEKRFFDSVEPWAIGRLRPVPASPSGDLALGDRGAMVEGYQKRLHELGYAVGAIDGIYGSLMRAAVAAFQLENGLPADGKIAASTRAALNSRQARPMPVSADRAVTTADDLAAAGSGTIIDAQKIAKTVKTVGGGEVANQVEQSLGLIDTAKQYTSMFGDLQVAADGVLECVRFVLRNWWLIIIGASIFIIWKTDAITKARVLAHRYGLHLGR